MSEENKNPLTLDGAIELEDLELDDGILLTPVKEEKADDQTNDDSEEVISWEEFQALQTDETEEEENASTEEEEETAENQSSTDGKDQKDEKVDSDKVAQLLYDELKTRGIAPDKDGEVNWDDVEGALSHYTDVLPEQIGEELIKEIPPAGRKLFDYMLTKGKDLSVDDLRTFYQTYLDETRYDVNNLDEETAEQIVKAQLLKEGKKEGIAQQMIALYKDEEVLIEEAKRYAESTKTDKILQDEKTQRRKSKEEVRQFAAQVSKTFKELDWRDDHKRKIQQQLSTGTTDELLSKIMSSPKGVIQLADFVSAYNEETGEINLDRFKKQIGSKDAKSLREKLQEDMFNSGGTGAGKKGGRNKGKISLDNLEIDL